MMIRSVAVDDEPRALEVLRIHAERASSLSLEATFVDPFKAIEYINDNAVDLVFLDINMPDINGLSVVKYFKNRPLVIFTTAHSEYAIESYEVEALDYLLKPFDFARFLLAVNKAQSRLESDQSESSPKELPGFLFVNTGNQKQRILLDELLYVESEGNYVSYVTTSGKHLVRASVKETLKLLPANQFVQIHRSYIVALQRVEKIEDHHVFVSNKKMPVGATYREHFNKLVNS